MAGTGSYWDVLAAGIAAYFANKGQNGGTPNQYPVQLPPEAKRIVDEAWNVYKAGGSPAEKDVHSMGTQFIGGIQSAPPNFNFVSDELKNQQFAGGVKIPKIDISKLPSNATAPSPTTPAPRKDFPNSNNGGGGLRNMGAGFVRDQGDGGSDPLEDESIYGWMTRTGGTGNQAGQFLPKGDQPPAANRGGGLWLPTDRGNNDANGNPPPDQGTMSKIRDEFNRLIAATPDLLKKGVPAVVAAISGNLGLAGSLVMAGLGPIVSDWWRAKHGVPAPPNGKDVSSGKAMAPPAPSPTTSSFGTQLTGAIGQPPQPSRRFAY